MQENKMQEVDEELKEKLQAEVKNLRRQMQAKEGEVNLNQTLKQTDDARITLSEELNDLWQISERCLEELEWTPPNIEESGEAKAHKTIVQSMFVRCQSIRENLQIILDTIQEL